MKKQAYMAPDAIVIEVSMQSICAGSGDKTFKVYDTEATDGWADTKGSFFDEDPFEY